MARKRPLEVYQRLFFDRTLLLGLLFVAMAYITRGTWVGAFMETTAIFIGIGWSLRTAMTNSSKIYRLLATLVLVLIWSLLSIYVGAAHGLVPTK